MKVIIPLAGLGTRMRPYTWSRPKALLHVAGNTVIGHLLNLMADITTEEVVFVVGYKGDEIEAWLREHYSHLDIRIVVQEEALGQAHAIWLCRDYLNDGPVLVAFGDGIVDAAYAEIDQTDADAVALIEERDDPRKFGVAVTDAAGMVTQIIEKPDTLEHKQVLAGVYWFRNGRLLRNALDTLLELPPPTRGEYYLADAYQIMLKQGVQIETKPTIFWLDAGNPENILNTNARLLGLGYGSDDAIERSYGEDFTVLPPVFLHETAVVDGCVLGPYVSVGPNVTLRRSVISNSIIDANSSIEHMQLDESLIGENVTLTGRPQSIFVGDNGRIDQ